MKSKSLGQSIRRGLVVGALAGFLAGWGAFAVRNDGKSASAAPATVTSAPIPTPVLPSVPRPPTLAPIPTVNVASQSGTAALAAPAAVPTLQPIPTFPPVVVQSRAVTRTS